MPKGLAIPVSANKGGGALVEREENQLDKLVVSALQEGDDANPFQDVGLSPRVIFRINDDGAKFDAIDEIKRVLRSFGGRLKIGDAGIQIRDTGGGDIQGNEGESHVYFEYMNLDLNEAREFEAPFEDLGDK